MPKYDWKNLVLDINTGVATFGPIVPTMMHMEIKEINYSNRVVTGNRTILRQIPSGTVRPAHSIILDDQKLPANEPYSPRIPIRTVQEDHVLEASSDQGPISLSLTYRLRHGRP